MHQQNGTAERKHRHITTMGLTLLAEAGLPLCYWGEAFITATHLINMLPTPLLQFISPVDKLFQKQPDFNSLKVFGCLCFPHTRPYQKNKLSFRSEPCVYLGYAPQYKGYKCLSRTGKIFITRHVIFDESRFPFKEYSTGFLLAHSAADAAVPGSMVPSIVVLPESAQASTTATVVPSNSHEPAPATTTEVAPSTVTPSAVAPSAVAPPEVAPSIVPPPIVAPAIVAPHAVVPLITNDHNMITRAKVGIRKPKVYTASLEPKTAKQALSIPHWKQAMDEEYAALMRNKTWELVQLPPNRVAIGSKWVFRTKYNPDGSIQKYKARLVAQGFNQRQGFDYTETFSPVIKPTTIRLILSLALAKGWPIRQLDVNNALLHGDLQEDVFMLQPHGYEVGDSNLVCKLTKALYGLKQAPRAWFAKLSSTLQHLGFHSTKSDVSLFIRITASTTIFVLIYVDDIIVTGSSPPAIYALI